MVNETLGVTEAFADDSGVDALLQQDRGVGMAEVVQADDALV